VTISFVAVTVAADSAVMSERAEVSPELSALVST
jgi:hypothetical protein